MAYTTEIKEVIYAGRKLVCDKKSVFLLGTRTLMEN